MIPINAQGTAKIKITVGSASFVATTYDNETARAFVAMLPMTISMNELNGNEKYFYLSANLPTLPEHPSTIHAGDLMLYGQSCIVLFYETFSTSYSYTKIGAVDNPTGLKSALGTNSATVSFELIGNSTGAETPMSNNGELKISNDGVLYYTGYSKTISLVDLNGRILVRSASNTLNANGVPKGIYILMIEGKGFLKTIKFKL